MSEPVVSEDAAGPNIGAGRAQLQRLCLQLGLNLGRFRRPVPFYAWDLAHELHGERSEGADQPPIWLRVVSSIAYGFSSISGKAPLEIEFSDLGFDFAREIGVACANFDPLSARSICNDATGVPREAKDTAHTFIDIFDSTLRAEAVDLFEHSTVDLEAACAALLVEPVEIETLAIYVFGEPARLADLATRIALVRATLREWLDADYITDDNQRIREMHRSPMQDGLLALTPSGCEHLAQLFRGKALADQELV